MPPRRYQLVKPEHQRAIVAEYKEGGSEASLQSIATRWHLAKSTVQGMVERAERNEGDPATSRGHRKRKLDEKQESTLRRVLARKPTASNRELARSVGGIIHPSTVSRYLAPMDPPITTKVIQDQEPEEKTNKWQAICRTWLEEISHVALDTRIYADETGIWENAAPKKGRSPAGKPIFRARPHWAKRYTLHVFVKSDRVLYWDLSTENANTEEVERVADWAVEYMDEGDTLIWDRLGRSGRAKNPVKQHYSPKVRKLLSDGNVSMVMLPPKGKYFNPCELLFNDLKSHYLRPEYPGDGSKISKAKLMALITKYMDERAPSALPGFFRARANGRYAREHKLV